MRRWQRRILLAVVLIVVAGGALALWRARTLDRLEREAFAAIEKSASQKDFAQARTLLVRLPDTPEREQREDELDREEFDFAVNRHDARTVRRMADTSPTLLDGREDARFLLARAALHAGDETQYETQLARTQADSPAAVLLQVDHHLRAGQTQEAQALLESESFTGTDEANRLIRLALLFSDNPARARELLTAAIQADRSYAEPYAFRGQLFEAMENWQAARADYVAALLLAPDKPLFWDQLAEYYRRRQSYAQAVDTWSQGYARTAVAEFWIKAWFWQKLTGNGAELLPAPDNGPLAGYATYLSLLPDGEYWDAPAYSLLPYASRLLERRQETYWLRLLAALKANDTAAARDLLASDPFSKRSWAPELKGLLLAVLQWRNERPISLPATDDASTRHQLYALLVQLEGQPREQTPPELAALLSGPDAWSACVLTEGWLRASVNLCTDTGSLASLPDWYRYGLAIALAKTGKSEQAVTLLESVPGSPESECLLAELQIKTGQTEAGLNGLQNLSLQKGPAAERAAWLLTVYYLGMNDLARAETVINGQPKLAQSITGQELKAQLALRQNNIEQATAIYTAIADQSTEAKVFLSKVAYANADWATARKLTEQLIAANPDVPAFWRNMEAINEAERTSP